MPKNIIPKDNIPKICEVREVENKIPTYEEFIKNYQQEQVNYEDLTHEDIISNKGFGPCSWNNSHCNCYVSQGFIPLNSTCLGCSDTTPQTWTHSNAQLSTSSRNSNCGGNLLISRSSRIRCADCGEESNWREWSFKCSSHYGYRCITNNRVFVNALNFASGLFSDDSRTQGIIRELIMNLYH